GLSVTPLRHAPQLMPHVKLRLSGSLQNRAVLRTAAKQASETAAACGRQRVDLQPRVPDFVQRTSFANFRLPIKPWGFTKVPRERWTFFWRAGNGLVKGAG